MAKCTALVFDIDHFAVHDGEGIRTTVFFKGCPLRCLWCHSPESQMGARELLRSAKRCAGCGLCEEACPNGLSPQPGGAFDNNACARCGHCQAVCPHEALTLCGRDVSVAELVREAARDKVFFRHSGGGVTLTGGEVLHQPDAAAEAVSALHAQGVDVLIETSGWGPRGALLDMASGARFYYDIKCMDDERHRRFTGVPVRPILDNLDALRRVTDDITLRAPLIPGHNDGDQDVLDIYRLARDMRVANVHLLPYNAAAGAKYALTGRHYPLEGLTAHDHSRLAYLAALNPYDSVRVSIIT